MYNVEDIFQNKIVTEFINTSIVLYKNCKKCIYLNLCRGGCKRHKDNEMKSYFCDSYKSFFKYN